MQRHRPPELEMTLDGEFVSPPTPPLAARVMLWAIIITVVAGGLSIAALALWVAMVILPVALVAGAVAWAMFRYRVWRAQRSFGGQRSIWRP